jgi:tRNA-Thr(GGU) m(6)t(6)A37 methyltransferase TsaA
MMNRTAANHGPEDRTMFELNPIGVVHSPFREAVGTPIQPFAAQGTFGTVELFEPFAEGLRDLEGFERIWLLFWCHRASAARLTVVPYRDTIAHGVFATRAPARPNPLGMSAVRLEAIRGRRLYVSEIDVLDGSPLLDVKPYVSQYDSYPGQHCGWLDRRDPCRGVRVADARFERAICEATAVK